MCKLTSSIIIACALISSSASAAPTPASTATRSVADSASNDHLHSGPDSAGLGVEHHNWSIDQINKAVRENPKSASFLVERGNMYMIDGDINKGMADFDKALTLDPHCGKAYIGRSRLYSYMKKWPSAFVELQKAAKMAPPSIAIDAVFESAFLHRELAQYPEAMAEYNRVLKSGLLSHNRQAYAFFQRGEVSARTGKEEAALADFSLALNMDPTLELAHLERARALARTNKLQQALAEYTAAIKCESGKGTTERTGGFACHLPEAYTERAGIYEKLGRADLAKSDKNQAQASRQTYFEDVPFMIK